MVTSLPRLSALAASSFFFFFFFSNKTTNLFANMAPPGRPDADVAMDDNPSSPQAVSLYSCIRIILVCRWVSDSRKSKKPSGM